MAFIAYNIDWPDTRGNDGAASKRPIPSLITVFLLLGKYGTVLLLNIHSLASLRKVNSNHCRKEEVTTRTYFTRKRTTLAIICPGSQIENKKVSSSIAPLWYITDSEKSPAVVRKSPKEDLLCHLVKKPHIFFLLEEV